MPSPVDVVGIPETAVLVFDGVFLLRRELRRFWSLAVYVGITPEETVRRALTREIHIFGSRRAQVERRYVGRYLPGQALYRQRARPESLAHVVVDNSDPGTPVILRWSPLAHR